MEELNKKIGVSFGDLFGKGATIPTIDKDEPLWDKLIFPEGWICFVKDGTCQGRLSTYGTISFSEGNAVYKIEKNIAGTWYHNDSLISLKPSNDNDVTLTCVDLLGTDDQNLKDRAVAYMNSICEENKESLLNRMEFEYSQWGNDLFITSLDKKSLLIRGESGKIITFHKTKDKAKIDTQSPSSAKTLKSTTNRGGANHGNKDTDSSMLGDDNPLLYGKWETDVPDTDGGKAVILFDKDHSMELNVQATMSEELSDSVKAILYISVKIGGTWSTKEDSLCIVNNPSLTKVNVDIDFDGVDDETNNALRPLLTAEIDKQKEDLAMQLLKGNSFEGIISIEELTDTELKLNNLTLSKVPQKQQIVIARVEGETGYLVEQGVTGLFVVLEWCDWNCTKSLDEYSREFEKQRDNNKRIVMLPIGTDEEGNDVFKKIIEYDCPSTPLGLRIQDSEISIPYYESNILKRYSDWKKTKR